MRGFGACLLTLALGMQGYAQTEVKYFKELGRIWSTPHRFEGLWPVLDPKGVDHFQVDRDARFRLVQIAHYNEKGKLTEWDDGWAAYQLKYDSAGRLVEAAFYRADGKLAASQIFGFAKEVIAYPEDSKPERALFDPRGRIVKTPRNDLGFEPGEIPLQP